MFNLFKRKPIAPLDREMRKWFEEYMLFLQRHAPDPPVRKRKVFTPLKSDWPIDWSDPEEAANVVQEIIAEAYGLDPRQFILHYFENPDKEMRMGTGTIFIQTEKGSSSGEAAGLYHGKDFAYRHKISLERSTLQDREKLIATLAHEISHAFLIYEVDRNLDDEHLTDLCTVFFGFGIFNANCAFRTVRKTNSWGYSTLGYLKQPEWSYALALLAFMRGEREPEWARHLNSTIQGDLKQDLRWVWENEEDIFRFDEE